MKKLHRFFLTPIPDKETFEIMDKSLVHQFTAVLRYTPGETCIVFDETSGDVVVEVQSCTKQSVSVSVQERRAPLTAPSRSVIAAVSIIKRDLFELVVQKLTELGVREIVPLISARTVKQSLRADRLEAIAREAVEQSGQHRLPHIHNPIALPEYLKTCSTPIVVFDPHQPHKPRTHKDQETIAYCIGPEGGWTDEEILLFEAHNVEFRTLGTTILRAETAAIVGAYELLR